MNRAAVEKAARPGRRKDPHPAPERGSRNTILWLILLIVAVSFTAYSNSLTNGFAYDDKNVVVNNPTIRSFSDLVTSLNPYRPIRWLTFAVDYHFWKLNPIGYHLSNVLLHTICGLLVFFVAKLLIRDRLGALFVSLLFCAHPVATEAVDNISNRNELLGAIFSLCATYFYIRKNESRLLLLAVAPMLVLALMSKEAIAVSLPFLFVAYDFYFNRDRAGKLSISRLVPGLGFLSITLAAIGLAVLGGLPVGRQVRDVFLFLSANTFTDSNAVLVDINIWVRAMAKGLVLVLYPRTLSADYPIPRVTSFLDGEFIGSLMVFAAFVLAVALIAKRSKVASFGLLWVFIFLLPVSNIVPITKHFMADRYVYAPSIGFCLFLGVVLSAVYRNGVKIWGYNAQKKSALLALVVFLAVLVGLDLRRNRDWESDYALWTRTVIQQPDSPLARINMGTHLQDNGRYADAIRQYKKAIAVFEGYNVDFAGSDSNKREPSSMTVNLYASAYNNIGSSYMKLRMYKEAIPRLKTAVAVNPYLYWAYCNLGASYINEGQIDEAIEALTKAIEIYDGYPEAHEALSFAYQKKGMLPEARRESDKARTLSETNTSK